MFAGENFGSRNKRQLIMLEEYMGMITTRLFSSSLRALLLKPPRPKKTIRTFKQPSKTDINIMINSLF